MDRLTQAIHTSVVNRPRRYDVFVCFCGMDTRKSFAGCLHKGLVAAEFSVFKDERSLTGEQIGTGLSRGINDSKIAILVISKNFGKSRWCLNELCQIMRCRAEQGQEVLPVFYDVDVSHVRDQKGEFGKAFRELAKRHTEEVVKKWKEALRSLTRIKGWSSQEDADGYLGRLVNMVVEKVKSILKPPSIEQIPIFEKKRREGEYEVFPISSPATKKSFASLLRKSLVGEEINVFSNDDSYLIGKDFKKEVRKAMGHCKIFIPIIAKDFASSPDCLHSLVRMVECTSTNGSKILPIFYKVDPSQSSIRFQRDMLRHNVRQCTRQQWQESLDWVCSIAGLVSANIGNGDEGLLMTRAIEDVHALLVNFNDRSPSTEY